MKKILTYILYVCLSILVTLLLEGIVTLGQAFDFSQYNWMGYTLQGIVFTTALCTALLWAEHDLSEKTVSRR